MATELEKWARNERQALREELHWYEAGAKLVSPSGDDITGAQVSRLKARLEHVIKMLADDNPSKGEASR